MNKTDWSNYEKMTSQDMCDFIDMNITRVVEKITPTIKVKTRSCKYLWSSKVTRLLQNKQTLKRRMRRNPTSNLAERIKDINNKVKLEADSSMRSKVRNLITPGDQSSFWRAVRISQNKGDFSQQHELFYEDQTAKTNGEKADLFAKFFSKKITDLKDKTNMVNCYNGELCEKISDHNFFTQEMITKILKSTKKSQCSGFDRVPMVYIRDLADVLAKPVFTLFNKIYSEQKIPQQWKIGKITPILKKGSTKDISNYRPITSLCALAKVFEKCILTRINELGDYTGGNQHGFKQNHSTTTALLELQHQIARSLDSGKFHGIVSLDLSAAFDMVDTQLLIKRMRMKGLPNDLTSLICDWLTDREAYVEIGGEASTCFKIPDGTVQGSVLGPVLFAIFISPMFDLLQLTSFADDSYINESDHNLKKPHC